MKYIFIPPILLLVFIFSAQADTTAYALQRNKINLLLSQRSEKFGHYDTSLTQKTGIFGWKTKKDIQNSNEILRDIFLNDNQIFKELKILMDYKSLQNEQITVKAEEYNQRIDGYMLTIKKLQDQTAHLKEEIQLQEKNQNSLLKIFIGIIALILLINYLIYRKFKTKNPKPFA